MSAEMETTARTILELHDVSCLRDGAALQGVSLRFDAGSFNVLVGDGGAGLLLRLASLLERPESGEVSLFQQPTAALDESAHCGLRSRHFGFVFSSPCLLPGLSVAENVAMPLFKIHEFEPAEAADRLASALGFVGLHSIEREDADRLTRFDQQRVALARALAHRPALLVLDRADQGMSGEQAGQMLETVRKSRGEFGVTVLITYASHAPPDRSDRILAVEGGVVCRDSARSTPAEAQGSSPS